MGSLLATLWLVAVGCVGINPDWDDERIVGPSAADDDSTGGDPATSSDAGAAGASSLTEGASVTGSAGGSRGGDWGTTAAPATSATSSSGDDTPASMTGAGSESSTAETAETAETASPGTVDVGFACTEDSECDPATGATCCTANQCSGYCFAPCRGDGDCDDDATSCAHDYCLFECDDDDEDCQPWPGFACEHGGQFCEI